MEYARLQRERCQSEPDAKKTRSSRSVTGPDLSVLDAGPPVLRLGTHSHGSAASTVQAKLNMSQPADRYEQEADRVAERVMGMQTAAMPGPSVTTAKPAELNVQRRTDAHTQVDLANSRDFMAPLGNGQPLDRSTSEFFESRFGNDLSDVRIHTGTDAADSARSINARAYTLGRDVVFGSGEYQPHTEAGKQLLAHELTHTIQQGKGEDSAIQRKLQVGAGLAMDTQGFTTTKTGDTYTCPAIIKKSIWNEIFTSLLFSGRVFEIDGSTNEQINTNLRKHMTARLGIVDFASKKKYSFGAGSAFKMNPDFWVKDPVAGWIPKPGLERSKAIDDLNVHPQKYSIACQAASQLTMEGGGKSPLAFDTGVAGNDWIPGDWGYIENTSFPPGGTAGLEGENIIYAGQDKFWGHFGPGNEYKTLKEWFDQVKSWHGGALQANSRQRPEIGLK
ncbi:MAG: hypothetical protein QOE96_1966 [Blastocatellia bacterium]|jgi:hypothetical protein|nr:hypothetical protein [Blastocatellia bacterium]